jgi:hypothetical protein
MSAALLHVAGFLFAPVALVVFGGIYLAIDPALS